MAIQAFGGPEQLRLVDLPDPSPGPGEVLIQIVASGVNPVDWKLVAGHLKEAFPYRFPLVPGWECAGKVEAIGPGVETFRKGDKVWAYARKPELHHGTYGELITLASEAVAIVPKKLLFEEAAGVPLTGLTSWQTLRLQGDVKEGAVVLVHAAAGGLGHLAVQIARAAGARVVGPTSSRNREFVLGLGAEEIVDYTRENFVEGVRRLYPEGVDVVLDTMGGEIQTRSLALLKPGGRLVSVISPPDPALCQAHGVRPDYVFVEPSGEQLRALSALVEKGQLKPHVSKIYPLADAAAALRESAAGHVRGKLVLNL
ncbi:MAG TPA: NADP-dependent oxidoreductase [Candidatus Polarisedimenticolaceae bacterium]|nr:NADP-dependent oxidoreductase [Candidatus Polarisedimenticolaceae bacterium]